MASIDYAFKAKVLRDEQELIKRYKKARLYEYCKALYINEGILTKVVQNGCKETLNDIDFDCMINGKLNELVEIEKIYNANNQRTKRLKKRIESMLLEGGCIFLTITFRNDVLDSTTESTRKQYIKRFLKSLNCRYIANIDYGGKRGREHYHAIVRKDIVDKDSWNYGNLDFERVRVGGFDYEKSKKKLSKYVCKLCNHAIKETTKRCCVMYSR